MNLGEFYTHVAAVANKGSTLTSIIPLYTRRAARWIERNSTLKYMERYVSFTLDPDADEPRVMALPDRLKSFNFVRLVDDDLTYKPLYQVDPLDVTAISDSSDPSGFWLDGVEYMWLDAIVAEERSGEMSYNQFTDWPSADDAEPWLVVNADDLLLAQTLILLAPYLRDADTIVVMKMERDEALKTLLLADQELRDSVRSEVMVMS